MLNKLRHDHKTCARPRAAENADLLRVGVVLDTVEAFEDALARLRGRYDVLRLKSTHDPGAEPQYRSLLVNFAYASTATLPSVVGSHGDDLGCGLKATCDARPNARHWRYALNALHRAAAERPWATVTVAAEVQLVFRPYYDDGRTRSHLLFKIARATTPGEMVRDFKGAPAPTPRSVVAAAPGGSLRTLDDG